MAHTSEKLRTRVSRRAECPLDRYLVAEVVTVVHERLQGASRQNLLCWGFWATILAPCEVARLSIYIGEKEWVC